MQGTDLSYVTCFINGEASFHFHTEWRSLKYKQMKLIPFQITCDKRFDTIVSTLTSQQDWSWFKPHGPFCVEFASSPCACVGFLWVLQLLTIVERNAC